MSARRGKMCTRRLWVFVALRLILFVGALTEARSDEEASLFASVQAGRQQAFQQVSCSDGLMCVVEKFCSNPGN